MSFLNNSLSSIWSSKDLVARAAYGALESAHAWQFDTVAGVADAQAKSSATMLTDLVGATANKLLHIGYSALHSGYATLASKVATVAQDALAVLSGQPLDLDALQIPFDPDQLPQFTDAEMEAFMYVPFDQVLIIDGYPGNHLPLVCCGVFSDESLLATSLAPLA